MDVAALAREAAKALGESGVMQYEIYRLNFASDGSSFATYGNASSGGSTRGGTPEQHAEAGRQSHKNDGKK